MYGPPSVLLMHTVDGPQLELVSSQHAAVEFMMLVVQHAEIGAAVADSLADRQMV